jgi:hypothetical protein
MAVSFQLVIDCSSADSLAHFWAEALHYVIEPPPTGFDSWDDFYRSIGVPEEELGMGADSIADPDGLHIDVRASGRRDTPLETRRELVDAEAARLEGLGATRRQPIVEEYLDHYAVSMLDPEGNEFDVH